MDQITQINNVFFAEEELIKEATVANFALVQKEGENLLLELYN